jgi:hypothetical protein
MAKYSAGTSPLLLAAVLQRAKLLLAALKYASSRDTIPRQLTFLVMHNRCLPDGDACPKLRLAVAMQNSPLPLPRGLYTEDSESFQLDSTTC